jgi:hypothetical protein
MSGGGRSGANGTVRMIDSAAGLPKVPLVAPGT